MKGLTKILGLRVKQGYRALTSIGLVLIVIGLPLIAVLSLGIFAQSEKGWYLSMIFFALIYGIHFSRADKEHLIHLGFMPIPVFVLEYFSLAVLLGLLNLFLVGNWMNLLVMVGLSIVVGVSPQVKFESVKNALHFPVNWIPIKAFEWKIGFRKFGWLIIFLIVMGLIFAKHSPAVSLVALILINFTSTSWYKDFEAFELFSIFRGAKNTLSKKIFYQVSLTTLVCIPLYIAFLLFFNDLWYLLLLVVLMGHLVNAFSIFYKYAGYHPSRVKTESDLAVAIFCLCTLVPFFAPVVLVYLWIYFFRAKKNIKQYYAPC